MTSRGEVRKNRVPEQLEIDACHGYLDDELKLVRPKVIVCLGKEAALSVLGLDALHGGVLENQGRVQWSTVYNAWVITSVHPSYLLHKPGEQELLVFDLEKAARWRDNPITPLPVDYRVLRTVEHVRAGRDYLLNNARELAFDWETNGVHLTKSVGICVAFSCNERESFLFPRIGQDMSDLWTPAELVEVDKCLCEILQSDIDKIGSNVPFDNNISRTTLGVWPRKIAFDCAGAEHCLYNHLGQRATSLKMSADRFTDMGRYDDPMDKWLINNGYTRDGKPDMGFLWKAPNELVWYYNCCDSDATLRVKHVFAPKLVERGVANVYYTERLPLALEHQEMDRTGVRVNRPYAMQLGEMLTDAMNRTTTAAADLIGHDVVDRVKGKADFNLNSYPQVGKLLFEESGVPVLGYTESGGPSTKEEFLLPVKDLHEIVPLILQHRAYTKLKGYVDGSHGGKGLLAVVDEDDYARMNTIVNGTETFRMVTRRPFALHTFPKTAPGMPSVRAMIVPRDGYKIVSRDYVQQEFFIQACAAGQLDIIEAMQQGVDVHEKVMKDLFHVTLADYVDSAGNELYVDAKKAYKAIRTKAKSTNFMILFRGGAEKLARTLKIDLADAMNYIADYGEIYPQIRMWQYNKIQEVRATGQSLGLFTTYRTLPAIYASWDVYAIYEAERQACNFPIQNGGAHVLARAMLRLISRWRETKFPARVMFSMHDQILAEAREDVAEEANVQMQEVMETPLDELGHRAPRTDGEIDYCWQG